MIIIFEYKALLTAMMIQVENFMGCDVVSRCVVVRY